MLFRNKKKTDQSVRRRVSEVTDSRANTFSYHSVRSTRETNTGRNYRESQTEKGAEYQKPRLRRTFVYSITLIIIVSIIYTFTLSTTPDIKVIELSSQSIVQPISIYEHAAQLIFKSSLDNQTKITVNTDKIAAQMESQFPELNAVTIIIPLLGRQPIVEVKPSESIIVLSNPQGKFVINQQGIAVSKLDSATETAYALPVTTDESGLHVDVGRQVLSGSSMVFIKTVVDQFAAKNIAIQSMTLSTVPYELDVQVRGEPYYIKFNLLADPLYSIGTYISAIKLSSPAPTQYIDVRIPGRAYYK